MMHNAIDHGLLTNAPSVPKEHPTATFPPGLYTEDDVIWCGIHFWPVCVRSPKCVPSQLRVLPQLPGWSGGMRKGKVLDLV